VPQPTTARRVFAFWWLAAGAAARMAPSGRVDPAIHCCAGILAGATSTTLLFPLDLVKVLFQADTSLARLPGVAAMSVRVARAEGFRALFQGLTPALVGSTVSWGGFFYVYERLKPPGRATSTADALVASVQAGAAMVLLTNPFWLVKTRLQLQTKSHGTAAYDGFADCLRRVVRDEGWAALYRGLVPALLLTSHGGVQFACYEQLKRLRPPSGHSQYEAPVYGALSKLAASVATYPYQVVKTRVQDRAAAAGGSELARTLACVGDTWRRERVRGFFRGCWANSVRVMPSAAITFWIYELVVAHAGGRAPAGP